MGLMEQQLWRQFATDFKSLLNVVCVRGGQEGPIQRQQLPERMKEHRNAVKGWWEEKMQAGPGLGGEGHGCSCGWGGLGRGEMSADQRGRCETT